MNKTEFVFRESGVYRRDVTERQIKFDQAILSQVGAAVIRKLPNVFPGNLLKNGITRPVSVSIGAADVFYTIELDSITIESCFAPAHEGKVIFPAFTRRDLPVMRLLWTVPNNMRLTLCLYMDGQNRVINTFFVAHDNEGRQYMLPLSNLYDDCRLCTGQYDIAKGSSSFDAIYSSVQQFYSSSWQGDLFKADREHKTLAMFGYKVEGDKFTQGLATTGNPNWTPHAIKISNQLIGGRAILNPTKP